MFKIYSSLISRTAVLLIGLLLLLGSQGVVAAQTENPAPPDEPVKLIFIHHSTGQNWLADGYGNLGIALGENNYFVSDTNYGWGPDGIGDRTDIPNWPEWFTGPESGRYLAALYQESEQHSWYTRTLADPGGENQIVMFKSCFPNSALEGSPDDPPARGEGLTVSNAKAIYQELLTYFATRPDKLFILITAPPLQDSTYAENARAFNTWLMTEWLRDYPGHNVAVFDFYNVLTDPDNHHWVVDGRIEHIANQGSNTLYYPSGDDHPSEEGSQKATAEFLPLLNAYYHRWQASEPPMSPPAEPVPITDLPDPSEVQVPVQPEMETAVESPPLLTTLPGGIIDDFEAGVCQWAVFGNDTGQTSLTCDRDEADAYSGAAGLHIRYDVADADWASCSLVFPESQDWSAAQGLMLYLRTDQPGREVMVVAYQGESPYELRHFEHAVTTTQEAVDGWQRVDIPWSALQPPVWEEAGPFDTAQAIGVAVLLNGPDDGELWVDDVSFLMTEGETAVSLPDQTTGDAALPAPTRPPNPEEGEEATAVPAETEDSTDEGGGGLCPGSVALIALVLPGLFWKRRPHK